MPDLAHDLQFCPSCGRAINRTGRFCGGCGGAVSPSDDPATQGKGGPTGHNPGGDNPDREAPRPPSGWPAAPSGNLAASNTPAPHGPTAGRAGPKVGPAAPAAGPAGPAAWTTLAREASTRGSQGQRGFFSALFDYRFERFAATGLIRLVYLIGSVFIALGYAISVIVVFSLSPILGLLTVFAGGVAALFVLALLRATLEFYYAVIRMSEDVHLRP